MTDTQVTRTSADANPDAAVSAIRGALQEEDCERTGRATAYTPDAATAAAVAAARDGLRDTYARTGLAAVHTYMDLYDHVDNPTDIDRGAEMVAQTTWSRGHMESTRTQTMFSAAVREVMHAATADEHDAVDILHRALTYARTTERPAPVDGLDDKAFAGAMADLLAASEHHTPGWSALTTACAALSQYTTESEPRPRTIPPQHGDSRS